MNKAPLTPHQERQVANVSANLFHPLEQRLGYFKPEEGANKNEVLLWWAAMLGDYAPEDLLWFAGHWLRTDEWGKFPRSPSVVEKILKEYGRSKVLPRNTLPDPLAGAKAEFHAWYMQNVSQHQAHNPFWWRKALEWKLERITRAWVDANPQEYEKATKKPHVTGSQVDVLAAGPLLWAAGLIPGGIEASLEDDYRHYQAQGEEMAAAADALSRGIGRLWLSVWDAEKRNHASMIAKEAQGDR